MSALELHRFEIDRVAHRLTLSCLRRGFVGKAAAVKLEVDFDALEFSVCRLIDELGAVLEQNAERTYDEAMRAPPTAEEVHQIIAYAVEARRTLDELEAKCVRARNELDELERKKHQT